MEHWKWNDVEANFDPLDADDAERYEACLSRFEEDSQRIVDGSTSALIRQYCNVFFRFFDGMFGEGAARRLFGERRNMRECEAAFISLTDYVADQKNAAVRRRLAFMERYTPRKAPEDPTVDAR